MLTKGVSDAAGGGGADRAVPEVVDVATLLLDAVRAGAPPSEPA